MRKSAAATARSLAEQSVAADQIARSAEQFTRQAAHVTKAMTDQAGQAAQVASAIKRMRQDAQQTSKALAEQARTMKEMTGATTNTAKQIALITKANEERADACAGIVGQVNEVRRITERNASGVKQTRSSTGELVAQAKALRALMAPARSRGNGGRRPRPSPETR
jgi:methyl-accepting chemotaxis protein